MKKDQSKTLSCGNVFNFIKFIRIVWFLVMLLFLITTNHKAWAGGIYIHENEIFLDDELYLENDPQKRKFPIDIPIEMQFRFDQFRFYGKPYEYIVFKIFEDSAKKNPEPIGYFTKRILGEQDSALARFHLPYPNVNYEVKYHVTPYFSYARLRTGMYGGFISNDDIEKINRFYKDPENSSYTEHLIYLTALGAEDNVDNNDSNENEIIKQSEKVKINLKDITIYFKNPTKVKSDLEKSEALSFQWEKGRETSKKVKNIKYSYRLSPIEDWSLYSTSKQATYNFLRPGNYTFQVKAKYTIDDVQKESGAGTYKIMVKKRIFGISTKELPAQNVIPDEFLKSEHYKRNKALLIGVTEYDDKASFIPLHFVNEDIRIFATAIQKYKFDVDILINNTIKQNILEKFEELLNSAKEGDRVIIYFSGHGASEEEYGFLIPTDGFSNNKQNTCIGFNYIEEWVEKMMSEKKVKHLLIILDACQSGLGVLSKSGSDSPIIELTKHPAAHMITAGLDDQEAHPDKKNKFSVFTKFLADGLTGSADYTKDNVITLTELLIYVQNMVSKYVEINYSKKQIPVMGKMKGSGEMIFIYR